MQLVDSEAVSRGLVRVSPGEDLVESLQTLARAAGWNDALVIGAGVLDLVELAPGDGADTVTLENAELVSLAGRIARNSEGRPEVVLRAMVMAGGELRSGRIVAAMTGRLVLAIDAVVDESATKPSRPTSPSPRAAATPAPTPSPAPAVVGDSARSASKPLSQSFTTKPIVHRPAARAFSEEDNPEVEPGDILDHPQLGRCEVVGDDESGGTRIRMSSGRVRVLRLDALRVLPGEVDDEGHTVFKIAGPRRG